MFFIISVNELSKSPTDCLCYHLLHHRRLSRRMPTANPLSCTLGFKLLSTSLFIIILAFQRVHGDPHEDLLYQDLMKNYNPLERPVNNNSAPVKVTLGISLQQIVDIDEKNQILKLNAWLNYVWNDYKLKWDPADYAGIGDVRFPKSKIWKPDVLLYNSVDTSFDSTFPTNMIVYADGSVNWIPPGIFQVACKIKITWFPFDEQNCHLKFGSWTYNGLKLNLTPGLMDMSSYIVNGEWTILDTPIVRSEKFYDCCPEPYPDLKFYLMLRRRTLYYGLNLIVPSLIISLMTILGFALPPDAGEKIGFEITILLSMCFFLGIVSDMTPPTSEAVPLIGAFFSTCMLFVSISVVTTVLVLNLHHRCPEMYEMSHFSSAILLNWLPWILMMNRPGQPKFTRRNLPNLFRSSSSASSASSHGGDDSGDGGEKAGKDSESLMRNVREIEDNTNISSYPTTTATTALENTTNQPPPKRVHSIIDVDQRIIKNIKKARETKDKTGNSNYGAELTVLLMQRVFNEIKFVTKRMEDEDANTEQLNDYKFAAMVIDRLCLILFSVFIVSSSAGILFSAPYIVA